MRFLSGLILAVVLFCAVVSSAQEQALRIKASDGDIYDITINTSDQALFQNAVGYVFDAAVYPLAGFRTNNDTLYVYKSGGGVSFKIYLGTSPTNGQTLVSDANKVLTFQTASGGATAWSAIGDAAALGTIDFAGFDQDITSSEDGGDVLTITNTDADRASSTNILVLADNDLADGEAAYLRMIGNAGVSPSTDYVFSQTAFTAFQAVDFSAASAFRIPVSSAPTVDNTGEVAFDTDIWGAGRGAQVAFDGTAATVLVGALVSDAPGNGQVPKWNTNGTITWEDDATGGGGSWSSLTAPTAATSFVSDGATETITFDFQSAFSADQFIVKQTTGNPTAGGSLFVVQAADADVLPIMQVENTAAVTIATGLEIAATNASGVITTAIDVDDAEITTAISAGDNGIMINGYKIIEIPAGMFNPKAGDLTGATPISDDADNTNDFTIDQLEFSASAENYISCTVNMPDDWDGLTAPKFRVVYYSGTGHASNTVEWDIQTGWIRPGTDSWIAALGTAVTTNHNPTTANVWYRTNALSPTPAGTAAAAANLKVRIFRDGDDATNDTHAATARLVKLLMQYKTNEVAEMTSW